MLVSMSLYMYFLCLFYMAFFCYVLHVLCHSFLQVVCCFGNSVASTRFLLQDEFNIQTTQCDNCIIVLSLSLSHPPTHLHIEIYYYFLCILFTDFLILMFRLSCLSFNDLPAYFLLLL